jgi:hypothetical protein
LRERAVEIIVLSVLFPILGWGSYELYTLNREVGEIRSDLKNEIDARKQLSSQIDKVESGLTVQIGNLSSEVGRLDERVDKLMDRSTRQ